MGDVNARDIHEEMVLTPTTSAYYVTFQTSNGQDTCLQYAPFFDISMGKQFKNTKAANATLGAAAKAFVKSHTSNGTLSGMGETALIQWFNCPSRFGVGYGKYSHGGISYDVKGVM